MKIMQRVRINAPLRALYVRWATRASEVESGVATEVPYGIYEIVSKSGEDVLIAAVLSSDVPSNKHVYFTIVTELEAFECMDADKLPYEDEP